MAAILLDSKTAELLEQAARDARDVLKFCHRWLGWKPHEGQAQWLLAPWRHTKVLVTGRRWGKSLVAGVEALHYAVTHPGSRQCIVSVTLDQARVMFDYIAAFCQQEPLLNSLVQKAIEKPFPTISFKHGSIITARSSARKGVYLRARGFERVIVDEADYVGDDIIDNVVRMMLADKGGQLVLITTPRPHRGLVYRELQRGLKGDKEVYVQTGSALDNPYIDHNYIRSLRDRMTAAAWAREVEGIYMEEEGAVFAWDHIHAAYESADWEIPEEPREGRCYVQGVDLAKMEDYTVHIVLDVTETPYRLVYFERYQRRPWPAVIERIRYVHQRYNCSRTLIDATGVGSVVLDEVCDVAEGFVFTARSKIDLVTNLQVAFERGKIRFPFIRELVDELQGYTYDDDRLQTDCVMALALALWAAGPRNRVEFAPSPW